MRDLNRKDALSSLCQLDYLNYQRNPFLTYSTYFKALAGITDQIDRRSRSAMVPDYGGISAAINPLDGSLIEAAADEHLVVPGWGNLTHAQHTQSFVTPSTPATQDIDLATGDFNCAILGTGSATVSAGTATITGAGAATEGTPVAFEVTGAGTVTVTIAGTVDRCNVITGATSILPVFFNSTGTFLARSGLPYFDLTEMPLTLDRLNGSTTGNPILVTGNLVSGNRYEVVTTEADHFGAGVVAGDRVTGLTTVLDANNTVQLISPAQATTRVRFRPGVDAGDSASTYSNAIALNDLVSDLLYFKNNGQVRITDGVNMAYVTVGWLASKAYEAEITTGDNHPDHVGTSKMQLSVIEINPLTGAEIGSRISSAIIAFTGHFPVTANKLKQAYGSAYPVGLLGIKSKKNNTWRTPS